MRGPQTPGLYSQQKADDTSQQNEWAPPQAVGLLPPHGVPGISGHSQSQTCETGREDPEDKHGTVSV